MQATAVLGPICTALSVSFVWPQVVRIYRLNIVDGIAPNGTLHGLAACTLWTLYGSARGIGPIIVSNAAVGVAMTLIGAKQISHRMLALPRLVAVIVAALAIGGAALAVSPVLAGWLAIVVGVTSIIPQTIYVARTTELAGVSLVMWTMVISSLGLWSIYGSLIRDWLVVTTNVLLLPCALYVLAKAARSRLVKQPSFVA